MEELLVSDLLRVVNSGVSKTQIEIDNGMPENCLSGYLRGTRGSIPSKWIAPLRRYVNEKLGTISPEQAYERLIEDVLGMPENKKTKEEILAQIMDGKYSLISVNELARLSAIADAKKENKATGGTSYKRGDKEAENAANEALGGAIDNQNPDKDEVLKQIAEIKKEKIPKERDTALGRKFWIKEQNDKIQALNKTIGL